MRKLTFFIALALFAGSTLLSGHSAWAALISVKADATMDHATISSAIAGAMPGDIIDVWGTITETDIIIDKNLTIQGKGTENTIVQGASSQGTANGRIFFINTGVTATIRHITLRHGNLPAYYGGAIWNQGVLTVTHCAIISNTQKRGPITNRPNATINIHNCIISDNITTDWGGGIYNYNAAATIDNSVISSNNAGQAGAVYNLGDGPGNTADLIITNSAISGNITPGKGALCNYGQNSGAGKLTLANCTVSNNTSANGSGGGVYNISDQGTATSALTNCTISGNSGTEYGGGAENISFSGGIATMTLTNCTVMNNIADSDDNNPEHRGGGIYTQDADTILLNTIVANNKRGGGWIDDDLNGFSPGANVTANNSLFEFQTNINLLGANNITGNQPNLNLGPLADNGGPTQTHAILGCPGLACDAGTDSGAPAADQRGYTRNGTTDIGAFEYAGTGPGPVFQSAKTTSDGTQVEVSFSKAMADPAGRHAQFVVSNGAVNLLSAALKDQDNNTIILTLATPANFSQDITIAYTAGNVMAADGTVLASFPQQQVVNTTVPRPIVTLELTDSPFDEDSGVATIYAKLSEISGWPVTVSLRFTGEADPDRDYAASGDSIVIPALTLASSITLTGKDDSIKEGNETIIIDADSVINGAESGNQQVTAVITDDSDLQPEVLLGLSESSFAENSGTATVTVTLSAVTGQDVTVNLDFSGTGDRDADYTASADFIIIHAGETSGSITLTGKNDSLTEGNETVITDIISVVNAAESEDQQVTATIADDDFNPGVTLGLSGSPFTESSGTATVTATLSAVSGQDVTVNLGFAGTASEADYTASGTSVLIPAGGTSGTITITGKNDSLDEPDKTVIVDIISVISGVESGTQQVIARIFDDDPRPRVSFTSASQTRPESVGTMTVEARVSQVSGRNITIPFTLEGTASQGTDYTVTPGTLHIEAGAVSQTVTIYVNEDSVTETDETIIIKMDKPSNAEAFGTTVHTATITDNESSGWIISEILADPDGDANRDGSVNIGKDEFVEIKNSTGADADISNWILSDAYGVRHTFPSGTVVADRCAIVVFGGGNPTGPFGHALVQTASTGALDLDDTGDTVMLEDNARTVHAIHVYGPEGGDNQSLTRDPLGQDPDLLIKHTTANGSGGSRFSPGTQANGTMFPGCNAPPTTTGIGNMTFREDTENTGTDLWPYFDDTEDPDSAMAYSIVNNSNPGLFHSINITGNRYLTSDYAENANGSADITLRATDTGGLFAETTFTLLVIPVNDPPLFVKGPDQIIDELAQEQEQFADNWAASLSPGPGDESGQMILGFELTNDNNRLFLEQPAIDITGRLTYTPFPHANGTATVFVSLKDDGGTENGGTDTSRSQFFITVNSVDYPPGISEISDQSADDSETIGPLGFTISDDDTSPGKLVVSVKSSNPALVPETGILLSGSGENRTITVFPTLNMAGDSVITVTVADESGNATDSAFTVSITRGPVIESVMSAILQHDADANETFSPGDTIRYATVISNTGDRKTEGLMFVNTIPVGTTLAGAVSADMGTLLSSDPVSVINISLVPGARVNIMFDVLISPGAQVGEIISNQGIIAYDSDGDGTEDTSWKTDGNKDIPGNQPAEVRIGGFPLVTAVRQVSDVNAGHARPGDELKYTVVIMNQSDYDINEIIYEDDIPLHTSYVPESVSAPPGSIVENESPRLRITGITLPARKEIRLSFRVRTDIPLAANVTEIISQGTVHCDFDGDGSIDASHLTDGDTSPGNPGEQPTVIPMAGGPDFNETFKSVSLYLDTDMNNDISPGDTLEYRVIIHNTGDQNASGVRFSDHVPANVTYVSGSVNADSGTVIYNNIMNRIEWIGDIAGDTSVKIIFHARADTNLEFGEIISGQGTVAYDTDHDGMSDSFEETDSNPDEPGNQPTDCYVRGGAVRITALKEVSNASGKSVRPGDEPEYRITLENHSGYYAQGVELTDKIPGHAIFVQGSAEVPGESILTFEESLLSLTDITIPAHDKVFISFRVRLGHVLPAGTGELVNQGAVRYDSDGDRITDISGKTDSNIGDTGDQPTVIPLIIPFATCFADKVSYTAATLNGAVNPEGVPAAFYFEYGKTKDYGLATQEKDAGSGYKNIFVSENIRGLDEETTYHCRLVLVNTLGMHYGADTTFTTDYTVPAGDAIHKDDPAIVGWATGWTSPVNYGILLSDRFRTPGKALGRADSDVSHGFVSLGTGGSITMTFNPPITNGSGWDFAVFENAATDTYLELAYVDVSSDGEHFVRFDSLFLSGNDQFGEVDPTKADGLAGKYRQGYGTLFDLAALAGKDEVSDNFPDIRKITHVRITDVFGGRDKDTRGNIIYDVRYDLSSGRAGFDLDAIGVIHQHIEPGDINRDGIISLGDAIQALKCLAGINEGYVYAGADVNKDGKIGQEEVIYVLRFLQVSG